MRDESIAERIERLVGDDPDRTKARDEKTVEGYLQ
jgi:hypothetical protein